MEDYSASPAHRAAAYWFIDGLPEVVSGLVIALSGGVGLVLWAAGLNPLFAFLGLAVLWKDRSIVDFLKARLTYPRTGYVRPPINSDDVTAQTFTSLMPPRRSASDKNVTHFRNNTLVPLILGAVYTTFSETAWFWLLGVWVAVGAMYLLNRRLERPYRWWELFALALAGSALIAVNVPLASRPFPGLVVAGAWLLVLGGGKLAWYLRTHSRPSQEGNHA